MMKNWISTIIILIMTSPVYAGLGGDGLMTAGGHVPGRDLLTAAENSNTIWVDQSLSSSDIQTRIDAAEILQSWLSTGPLIIKFTSGTYSSLDLTLGTNNVIIDAGDPGVVLEGTITASGSPTGVYIYTWDHPSGTYPASLTLTNITES